MKKLLTGSRVARLLQLFRIITTLGVTKLPIAGLGNYFERTNADGSKTPIHIFNVAAFASADDAQKASGLYKEGVALELAGDPTGADAKYREALNLGLSFSVLEQNAPAYQSVYEVTAKVEMAASKKQGKDIVVLNNVRPVVVGDTTVAADPTMFAVSADLQALKAAPSPADLTPDQTQQPDAPATGRRRTRTATTA